MHAFFLCGLAVVYSSACLLYKYAVKLIVCEIRSQQRLLETTKVCYRLKLRHVLQWGKPVRKFQYRIAIYVNV